MGFRAARWGGAVAAVILACTSGCRRPEPKAPAPPPAPAASRAPASAASALPGARAGGVHVTWSREGPQQGQVQLGDQRVALAQLTGGDWPATGTWQGGIQATTLGGRAMLKVTLRVEHGDEDLRTELVRAALLPNPPTSLKPLWAGEVARATTELDACTLEVRAELRVQGDTLVVKRVGEADWQPPSEDENSQTPSFMALKATCKAPAATEARVRLPAR